MKYGNKRNRDIKKIFFGIQRELFNYGGTACSIILRDATMRPRATKDIDMILVVRIPLSDRTFIQISRYPRCAYGFPFDPYSYRR